MTSEPSAVADPHAPNRCDTQYDVVVYGGTSAGIIAAVQVRIMGYRVIVVSPDTHLGGLTSNGLGWTDSGRKEVIGGLSRAFYQRIKAHYDQPDVWRQQKPEEYSRYRPAEDAMWVFEPHVAEETFEGLIQEYDIEVERDRWLDREDGVTLADGAIQSIRTLDGSTYSAKIFLDATYTGDLMAAAGVSFHVGREANSQYDETLNGVQTKKAVSHQFRRGVDPYVIPGDPSSGLLPRIRPGPPGAEGSADDRVQAYNYRLCMTDDPSNRVTFTKPEGYDPFQYELLLRSLEAGSTHVHGKFDPAPNRKTDTNNHGSFSTDNIGMNYDYPTASYERRREIEAEHEQYQRGYFYFLCTDPRVPPEVQERMKRWGLSKDEFETNEHWPNQIYVREARRMISDFVMTERHLRGQTPTPRPVGMGSYNMDSHNVQRYVAIDEDGKGQVRNEGDIQISPGGPYPISYDALIPRREECLNLLVPVCLSSSHIAYGSIRMEPVFMILGQSAATGACLAIAAGCAVQDIDADSLQQRLLRDGQVLVAPPRSENERRHPLIRLESIDGIVIDDVTASVEGPWVSSQSARGFVGNAYLHDNNEGKGERHVTFTLEFPEAGRYDVRVSYTAHPNRARRVPIEVAHRDGTTTIRIDQRVVPKIGGMFRSLGTFDFDKGKATVTISNEGTDGYVIVDAVQCVPGR